MAAAVARVGRVAGAPALDRGCAGGGATGGDSGSAGRHRADRCGAGARQFRTQYQPVAAASWPSGAAGPKAVVAPVPAPAMGVIRDRDPDISRRGRSCTPAGRPHVARDQETAAGEIWAAHCGIMYAITWIVPFRLDCRGCARRTGASGEQRLPPSQSSANPEAGRTCRFICFILVSIL